MKIKNINWHINYFCTSRCDYCYLTEESRKDKNLQFTKWNEVYKFLSKCNLDDIVTVNLSSGELSLFPELIEKAIKTLNKVKRNKDVQFKVGLYTNGIVPSTISSGIITGDLDINNISLSWDGINSHLIRKCPNPGISTIRNFSLHQHNINVIVRSALSEILINDIEESLKILHLLGFRRWEYYYLLDYDKYTDPEFIEKFKYFLDVVDSFSNVLEIYNRKVFEESLFSKCGTWCNNLGSSIDIGVNGELYPCGSYSNYYIYHESTPKNTIENPDFELLEELNNFNCSERKCEYKTCEYKQCTECIRISKYRTKNVHTQQCKLRELEWAKWRHLI